MSFQIQRTCGGKATWYSKHACYLKFSPMNPGFGSQYDGTTTAFGQGYTSKPMNWLYRFRYNTTPRGVTPLYLRNPGGKTIHWLEVSLIDKAMEVGFSGEFRPHLFTAIIVISFTAWQISRYLLFHPELTLYMLAMYPTKVWLTQHRYNDSHPLDKPVFRYAQRAPEFYWYDPYRDLIKLGVLANDPYVDYIKSIGLEKELVKYADEPKVDLVSKLPFEWRKRTSSEPTHDDRHHDAPAAHH
jgi:hypothetical protein